eukprot:Nk52_evm1s2062 gene=Nk52_evmTU1s2062
MSYPSLFPPIKKTASSGHKSQTVGKPDKQKQQLAQDKYYSKMLQEKEDLALALKLQESEHRRAGHNVHVYSSYFEHPSEPLRSQRKEDTEALLLQQIFDLKKELENQKAQQNSQLQNMGQQQNQIGSYISQFEKQLAELKEQAGEGQSNEIEISRLRNAHQERIESMARTRTLIDMNEGEQESMLEQHEKMIQEQALKMEAAKQEQKLKLQQKLKERRMQKTPSASANTSSASIEI